jgi:hypothetical protein
MPPCHGGGRGFESRPVRLKSDKQLETMVYRFFVLDISLSSSGFLWITNITGKKECTTCKIFAVIRRQYNKKPGDFITIYEFCEHIGLNEEKVRQFLIR